MFAAIVIPNFSLQAVLRHEPEAHGRAVALLTDDSKKARVCEFTAAAGRSGVSAGMASTQAKARCPGIVFRVRSKAQEAAADEILLECAYASAPYIEATAPGICTLDLRGLPLPDEAALERWASALINRAHHCLLDGSVGIGSTPGLALQAARKARPYLHVTDAKGFWDALPIAELCPPPEMLEILRKWGIAMAGQFLALGKEGIADRLGKAGVEFFDGIRCEDARPLKLTVPRQIYEEFREFEEPIERLEPLLFMVRRFLEQLTQRMEPGQLAVQKLEVVLRLESGEEHTRTLEIPAPTRETEVLFRIAHNYLETVRTPSAVAGLRLTAQPCASESRQSQLFDASVRDPAKFYEMIGRLSALLGPGRVGRPVVEPGHRPDNIRMEPITPGDEAPRAKKSSVQRRGLMLRRYRPPLPATVRLRAAAPVFVKSSGVTGTIVKSSGPWRSSGNWWENLWAREEWDVETKEGGLFRLYRDNEGWFVEGAYD